MLLPDGGVGAAVFDPIKGIPANSDAKGIVSRVAK